MSAVTTSELKPTPCGELACQKDSYLKRLTTTVVSCEPRAEIPEAKSSGKKKKGGAASPTSTSSGDSKPLGGGGPLLNVVLGDTVLFPEGGGQPCDKGYLTVKAAAALPPSTTAAAVAAAAVITMTTTTTTRFECTKVENVNGVAVHVIQLPKGALDVGLAPGDQVEVVVDWPRRWDHMAQHSAQHLVTALALRLSTCGAGDTGAGSKVGIETLSWNLGEAASSSFLELDTPNFSDEQRKELEAIANDAVVEGFSVLPSWHSVEDVNSGAVDGLRKSSKALPESVTGPVRVLSMLKSPTNRLDTNTCCGTHVANTAHLQAVKLLKVEKVKKGSNNKPSCKVHFVAGQRVLNMLGNSFAREQALTQKLSAGPNEVLARVDDLALKAKAAEKSVQALSLELVALLADSLLAQQPLGGSGAVKALTCHRPFGSTDNPSEFGKALATELDQRQALTLQQGRVLLLTIATAAPTTGGGGGGGEEAAAAVAAAGEVSEGFFLVAGPPELVAVAGPAVADALSGRGGGKGDRFQGKCSTLSESSRENALHAAQAAMTAASSNRK